MGSNRDQLSDRRRFPRTAMISGTAIVLARNTMSARLTIVDLSASGVQLLGELQLSEGEQVRVQLQIDDSRSVNLEAVVKRSTQEPEQGHRVALSFRRVPVEIEDRIQRLVLAALERQRANSRPSVLVLDDDPEIRSAIERDLRAIGRSSSVASTPLHAVRHLQDQGRSYDVALIDWHLGNCSGIDMIEFLADEHPTVRRVLMSGKTVAWEALTRVDAFLAKPWSRDRLREAVVSRFPRRATP